VNFGFVFGRAADFLPFEYATHTQTTVCID
jgi:hypothetical protein